MALRYYNAVPDTLIGVLIHFAEIQYLASAQTFALQVWSDASGTPGALITSDFDNYNLLRPQYSTHPDSLFIFYPLLDSLFIPEGNFHVGFIQQNPVSLNIGLDKNTNTNTTRLLYQLQNSTSWLNSSIEGSVMFRPVFKSGMPYFNGIENSQSFEELKAYPNPVSDALNITFSDCGNSHDITVYSCMGQIILSESLPSGSCTHTLNVSSIPPGGYILQVNSDNGSSKHLRLVID